MGYNYHLCDVTLRSYCAYKARSERLAFLGIISLPNLEAPRNAMLLDQYSILTWEGRQANFQH